MATVLFISPHQDDETLSMGMAIANHSSNPNNDVYVLSVFDGTGSSLNGYPGFPSGKEFSNARKDEQRRALAKLGVPASKISYLDIKDNTGMSQTQDAGGETPIDKIVEYVVQMAEGMGLLTYDDPNYRFGKFSPDFEVKTTSPTDGSLRDPNPASSSYGQYLSGDHKACGLAVRRLQKNYGLSNPRFYCSPYCWENPFMIGGYNYSYGSVATTGTIYDGSVGSNVAVGKEYNANLVGQFKNALQQYTTSTGLGIGDASVHDLFKEVNKCLCSYYHA